MAPAQTLTPTSTRHATAKGFMRFYSGPGAKKALLGDGNYGGFYQRPDAEMQAIWDVAVEETRAVIADGWA